MKQKYKSPQLIKHGTLEQVTRVSIDNSMMTWVNLLSCSLEGF